MCRGLAVQNSGSRSGVGEHGHGGYGLCCLGGGGLTRVPVLRPQTDQLAFLSFSDWSCKMRAIMRLTEGSWGNRCHGACQNERKMTPRSESISIYVLFLPSPAPVAVSAFQSFSLGSCEISQSRCSVSPFELLLICT